MKKLFYLILLTTVNGYAQISVAYWGGTTAGGSGTSLVRSSQTYNGANVYLVQVLAKSTETPTLTSPNITWTLQDFKDYNTVGSPTIRMCIFRGTPATTVSNTITITWTVSCEAKIAQVFQLTGADVSGTNGSNAVVSITKDAKDANANPTLTCPALSNSNNAILAFFGNLSNPFTGTPETGWTEVNDAGIQNTGPTVTIGAYAMFKAGGTDNTPTVTASASDWAGIAIEIKTATKRRVNIL